MTSLADAVLPLVRTRADLHRWRAANAYGRELHEALATLQQAALTQPAADVLSVTQRAIGSALRVILRADDSSGVIGDAIKDLLRLHAELARAAPPHPAKLVAWMIALQFDNDADYFTIDPAAYAPALGEKGLKLYRAKLAEIAARLGPKLTEEQEKALWEHRIVNPSSWKRLGEERHIRFLLEWNGQRLAVWDRDVAAIIATHARDRKVAAWLQDTAEAFAEIGEIELAIDWAKQATDFDRGHQSAEAAGYWCALLAEHRPQEEMPARLEVFRRWPTATHASAIHRVAGDDWPSYRDDVLATLEQRPREAVIFALHTLADVRLAWALANSLELYDQALWESVAAQYQDIDPLAVLPVYTEMVLADLGYADAQHYRSAAHRLATMRTLASNTDQASALDEFIAELRATHSRRPRLQQEFTRAGLP